MDKNRIKAIIVGALIIFAYAVLASTVVDSKLIVTIAEVLSGLAVIGIAVIMYPLFKPYSKSVSIGYFIGRSIEGGLMVIAGVLFITSSTLKLYDQIYLVHTYIFIVSALLFYYLLFKSKLVPRFLSIWGFIAAILLLIPTLIGATGNAVPMIANIIGLTPIILNEFTLAIWLIVKGFNTQAIKILF